MAEDRLSRRGGHMVISAALQRQLEALSDARGDDHRAARARLLEGAAASRAEIARLSDDGSVRWPVRSTAAALLLALDAPALFDNVERWARGDFRLGPGAPLGGAPLPSLRAERIAGAGPRVLPRAVELLWNERDRIDDGGVLALVLAIGELAAQGVDRSLAALAALVEEGDAFAAAAAAEALSRTGSRTAVAPLLGALGDASRDLGVRCAAATGLGLLRASEAAERLLALFVDPGTPAPLRVEVAVPLARIAGEIAVAPIVERLSVETDTRTVQRMVDALADTRALAALEPVRRLAREHPDGFVREAARGAADLLARRVSAR
ncbi:HEAT repeat domain-containing protein [Sorangium sp. So ce394]|uniref:HEAT repeat domain-containing protein n=1 Tax=Sorangium sp. So ce394 TaxID=3133310 RepID=UPI003F5C2111